MAEKLGNYKKVNKKFQGLSFPLKNDLNKHTAIIIIIF